MFIRVKKCGTFGIKKAATKSVQYLPKVLINSAFFPTVKIGESFKYLGRYFNFNMSDDVHVASPATIKITTTLECVNVIYFSRNRSIRTTKKYLYKTTLEEHTVRSFLAPAEGRVSPFLSLRRGGSVHFRLNYYIHKSEISSLMEDLMSNIDSKPLHPKNKLLLYSRYVWSGVVNRGEGVVNRGEVWRTCFHLNFYTSIKQYNHNLLKYLYKTQFLTYVDNEQEGRRKLFIKISHPTRNVLKQQIHSYS